MICWFDEPLGFHLLSGNRLRYMSVCAAVLIEHAGDAAVIIFLLNLVMIVREAADITLRTGALSQYVDAVRWSGGGSVRL